MTETVNESTSEQLAALLRSIGAGEPAPWYPGEYARQTNTSRNDLDEPLARLRLGGFVRLTDWEAGKGQGYLVTVEGRRALRNPGRLSARSAAEIVVRPSTDLPQVERDPIITRSLIAIQVGLFIVGLIQALELGFTTEDFLTTGISPVRNALAVSATQLHAGAWWTMLSYALVHGGLLHLGFNLLGHGVEATFVERLFGRLRFALVYLIAVWCGGAGAVLANPASITIGSSGGLCGIFAAEVVWALFNRRQFLEHEWQSIMQGFIRGAVLITIISLSPGVSWGGHLGGAMGGGLVTAFFHLADRFDQKIRAFCWLGIGLAPAVAAALVWWRLA